MSGDELDGVRAAYDTVADAYADHLAADLTALPFAHGSFDGFVSWFSTIHLDQPIGSGGRGVRAARPEPRDPVR